VIKQVCMLIQGSCRQIFGTSLPLQPGVI